MTFFTLFLPIDNFFLKIRWKLTFFTLNSFWSNIKTPAQLEKLRKGEIGDLDDTIVVFHTAHSDVLSLAKEFAHSKYYEFRFLGKHSIKIATHIDILPRIKHCVIEVLRDEQWIHGVPSNYVTYKIYAENSEGITNEHLNEIFQWKDTVRLHLLSRKYVTPAVYQRIDELSALKNLRVLRLNIEKSGNDQQITVRPFLEKISTLKELQLTPQGMDADAVQQFVDSQVLPEGWIIKRAMDEDFQPIIRVVRKKRPFLYWRNFVESRWFGMNNCNKYIGNMMNTDEFLHFSLRISEIVDRICA